MQSIRKRIFLTRFMGSFLAAVCIAAPAYATTPAEQLTVFAAQSGQPPQISKGQAFFNNKHGAEWSCASCHTSNPKGEGKHAKTEKRISPLAPTFNPDRFTDSAKTEKWFRRNCNDVVGRECSASEKADVLAWLISLKS
jgi:mono/diheme cytochrome c family protein